MSDAAAPDMAAFERGLKVAGAPEGRAGVLSTIFSTRALGLTGELAPASQADYLSGLLIGHGSPPWPPCCARGWGALHRLSAANRRCASATRWP